MSEELSPLAPLLDHLTRDLTPATLPETHVSNSVEGLQLRVRATETGWQASIVCPTSSTREEAQQVAEDLAALIKSVSIAHVNWQRI